MKVYYDKENRRLVYIGESATPDFWGDHWDTENFRGMIERGKNNRFILRTLGKYLPDKNVNVLEGGCGRGQVVYCMHAHGYKAIGVDFAKRTIEQVKSVMRKLDLIVGDVRDLPFPNNYFGGYWSLGVIEHFWDGYHDILKEMRRVLISGGYVFLSFPYMSPLRRLKARLGLYKEFDGEKWENKESFYQFALDQKTVIKDFKSLGFELLDKMPISGIKGLKDEVSIIRPSLQKLFDYQGESFCFRGFKYVLDKLLATLAGHTIFLVFRNRKRELGVQNA